MLLQRAIKAIYPSQCTGCEEPTQSDFGLCPTCWSAAHFISGTKCDTCGAPLPGADAEELAHCDDCLRIARPWSRGRSALVYSGVGRTLVLRFKHGDRSDLAPALGRWLAGATEPILPQNPLFVPVPLHWTRLLRRRYNQAALLADQAAKHLGAETCPDALLRTRRTHSLDGQKREARFAALEGAIGVNPKRAAQIAGRNIVLVDDVMTSGATLATCAEICLRHDVAEVCVATLARVVKDV